MIGLCRWLKEGRVKHLSFDHDLGSFSPFSGYTVARFIERLAYEGRIPRLSWDVHSANVVGRENIRRAMLNAEAFWTNVGLVHGP